jgi:hypothetical protein
MNRKQKVLTVIALIAFVVIGAFHYLGWPTITFFRENTIPYTVWEETTWAEANQKRSFYGHPDHPENYFADAIKQQVAIKKRERAVAAKRRHDYLEERKARGDPPPDPNNFDPEEFAFGVPSLPGGGLEPAPTPPDDAKAWIPIVNVWHGKPIWSPQLSLADQPVIADVRMPWFMLGVMYVGSFFLLADGKKK